MKKKKANAIHRQMKAMGYDRDAPNMQTREIPTGKSKKLEILTPGKTLLGKAVEGSGFKTEFINIPIVEATNPYRRIFNAIAKGEFDFERKEIKGTSKAGIPKAPGTKL